MSPLIKATHLLVLISTLIAPSAAQSVPRRPPVREQGVNASAEGNGQDEVLTLEQRRALWLLDQLFEQAKACDNETLRLWTLAQLADLLWKFDEPRARRQFEEALGFIDAIKPDPQDDASDPPLPFEYGQQYQLRLEVLELISHHDSEWARKLGSQTEIELSTDPDPAGLDPDEAKQSDLGARTNAISTVSEGGAPTTPGAPGPSPRPSRMGKSVWPASLEQLLSQADTARSPVEKDGLYARAVLGALAENDFELALSITEKIKSRGSQASLAAMTRHRAATAALNKEDFVVAGRYARDLPSLVQRATVFDQMLQALEKRKDIGRAAEILTEAEQVFEKAQDGLDKARAILIIASAAARIDPLRGLEILSSGIAAINHADLDDRSHRAAPRNDLNPRTFTFDQVFSTLTRTNFDRVLQLAQSIDKKEVSVLAQLAICRGLLTQIPTGQ